MFEYPLTRAAHLRRVSAPFDTRYGFLAVFGLLFYLNGGPGPRTSPDLPPQIQPSGTAASAHEMEQAPTAPPLPPIRVLGESIGGPSERTDPFMMALRTDLLTDGDTEVVQSPISEPTGTGSVTQVAAPAQDAVLTAEPLLPTPPDVPPPSIAITETASTSVEPVAPSSAKPLAEGMSLAQLSGQWVPHPDACVRSKASSYLPLELGTRSAKAGGAVCRFAETRRDGKAWNIVAKCASGGEAWTAHVRLTAANGRLTWSSERGTQAYQRCGRPPERTARNGRRKTL